MQTRDVECIALSATGQEDFAPLSTATLQSIYAHATAGNIQRFHQPLLTAMAAAQIDTPLRQAHFLAQLGHESGELRYTEELASGAAYEGRRDLGNTQPGDGPRFKGRGLIQLTGRANYAAFGAAVAQDLCTADHPKRVSTDTTLAVTAATWFWTTHHLNTLADKDDFQAITHAINGGLNGFANRQRLLQRAKSLLLPANPHETPGMALATIHAVASATRQKRRRTHFRRHSSGNNAASSYNRNCSAAPRRPPGA